MTISYATREGARSGAAFAAGNTTTMICNPADGGLDVDKNIIAAVERVLQAPGSQVAIGRVQEIRIYRASSTGAQIGGQANVWSYNAGSGPIVDGQPLDFTRTTSGWNACSRVNFWAGGVAPDSLGVSIQYSYLLATPLASLLGFFGPPGGATIRSTTEPSWPSTRSTDRTHVPFDPPARLAIEPARRSAWRTRSGRDHLRRRHAAVRAAGRDRHRPVVVLDQ